MAQCISPFYKKDVGMSFPCGKCYPCKMRRVQGWSFRLQQEAERSDLALFVTLTYSNEHVPITPKKFMTVSKRDVQNFFKRLRQLTWHHSKDPLAKKIKYYAAAEYGPKTYRPHYHLIIFNADYEMIEKAWTLGDIHYGHLTPASACYTLKYISKDGIVHFEGDDREKEFSLMSKRLGDNYLTAEMIAWHRRRDKTSTIPERYNITVPGGYKIAIPRYYKNKIWTPLESQIIGMQFVKHSDEQFALLSQEKQFELFKKNDELREYFSMKNKDERDTSI